MKIKHTLTRLIAAFVTLSLLNLPAFATKPLPPDPDADLTFEVEIIGPRRFANSHSQPTFDSTASEPEDTLVPENSTHVDISGYADEVLRLVNIEREAVGLSPLSSESTLTQIVNIRASEVAQSYSHIRPNGNRCFTVFDEFTTELKPTGENIASGQETPEAVVKSWMNSEGHKENILRDTTTYLGVGVCQKENGIICWVQMFAK